MYCNKHSNCWITVVRSVFYLCNCCLCEMLDQYQIHLVINKLNRYIYIYCFIIADEISFQFRNTHTSIVLLVVLLESGSC